MRQQIMNFSDLIRSFFTNKDYLPSAEEIPGTLFTPLHFVFAGAMLFLVIFFAFFVSKKSEKTVKTVFLIGWAALTVLEIVKIAWETLTAAGGAFEWGGVLPLYPCSIFMYAMPLAIWGNGKVRYMGCGYVCTLGFLGAAINFIYPANVLSNYSCISFAGLHTFFYHGFMLFCALAMIISGYHSYKKAYLWSDLLLPSVPALAVSVIANIVNFSKIGSDYMFFKLNSFFFAPIGAATHDAVSVIIVYAIYLVIHALPYIPGFIANRNKTSL
jgi:hypothetical protein